jgi:hypothetical protein
VKHRLPTLDGKSSSRPDAARSQAHEWVWSSDRLERPELSQKVIAVAHVDERAASAKLATELCAAFALESAAVSALVTIDSAASAHDAEAVFIALMEAGARQAKLLRKPAQDPRAAVESAIAELAGADWIIAWGNVLPQLFKPFFTIVVTGHRRGVASANPLVTHAQLEVTSPGPELATLLARRLTQETPT